MTKNFLSFLSDSSEMVKRTKEYDWSKTSLGPIESWPSVLQNTVGLIMQSGKPMLIHWGEDFIQIYNDAFRPILGQGDLHPRSLGGPARETWAPVWAQVGPILKSIVEKGDTYTEDNWRLVLKRNGYYEETFHTVSLSPIRSEEGVILGVLGVGNEITQKIQNAQKLRDDHKRFQEALKVRDDFISVASNELKSPLSLMKGQTTQQRQLLLKKDPRAFDKERIRMFSETIDQQLTKLNHMVDDMVDIGVIRKGHLVLNKVEAELGRIVRDAIESIKTHFDSKNFPVIKTQGLIKGNWDELRIKQVVVNILINAIRFGKSSPITVEVTKNYANAMIKINDRGIGIEKENLEKIFDQYERVGRNGLFLTKQIVLAHNGKIWVESELGEGSTFCVEVPLRSYGAPGSNSNVSDHG